MVRGPVSLVIVMLVLLGMFGLVSFGPAAFTRYLPDSAVAFLDRFKLGGDGFMAGNGLSGTPRNAGQSPADYLNDSSDGIEARGPIAARAGNLPYFIDKVFSGYSTRLSTLVPAEITTIRPVLGCNLTPPMAGTVVGHVTAARSDLTLSMMTYNDVDLANAIQTFADVYRKSGSLRGAQSGDQSYEAFDVAVTETRAPVYLVLVSTARDRIWNIHLAPGAQIERVVLLGGAQAGVANLDPLVPVEVILSAGMKDCAIQPFYPLNAGHLFFQSVESGAISQADADLKLAKINEAVQAYDRWFLGSFGVGALETRAGWDAGTAAFVGPLPASDGARAVWATLEGAKIRTTQDTYFEIRGQSAEGADFKSRVIAIATSFAWGDLNNLKQGAEF